MNNEPIPLHVEDAEPVQLQAEENEPILLQVEDLRVIRAVSPRVQVEAISGGHRITITDLDGEHIFVVPDGIEGNPGRGIVSIEKTGTSGRVATYTITYTNGTTQTYTVASGADGVSPTIGVTSIPNGHRITVTDANGTRTFDVMDGAQGNGGRGIVSIEKTSVSGRADTYTITYTDNTTSGFTVINGENGDNGYSPTIAVTEITGGHRVTVTDKSGSSYFDVLDGQPGLAGTSPTASVIKSGGSATITITDKNGTTTATVEDGQKGDPGADAVIPANRVSSLNDVPLAGIQVIDAVGAPVYVADVTQYAAYGLTDTGWYVFARILAPDGAAVSQQTAVSGAAGSICMVGADHVDVAVRFSVAAVSQIVTVAWSASVQDAFVFKATDLAVRNMDYRSTFYVYDIAPYRTWTYALTTDATFVAGKNYYTESGGEYTLAEVTAGGTVPANTYYVHTKLTFSGMVRNVTYRLNVEHALLQGLTAGINVLDMTFSQVDGVKLWTLLNTHTNIPA